jgi:hypothetical protein
MQQVIKQNSKKNASYFLKVTVGSGFAAVQLQRRMGMIF